MAAYSSAEIAEMLDRLDRQEKRDLLEQEAAKLLAQQAPAPKEPKTERMPMLSRATMSAADKSRFIRQHGRAKYDALPWIIDE